jgi:membrane protease YdiL (CAAX protease family)
MLMTLLAAVVAVGVFAFLADVVGIDVDRPGDDLAPGVTIAGTYVQDLALIVSAFLLARWLDPPVRPRQFGFRRTPFGSALGWLVLAWVIFIVFSYAWTIALDISEQDDLPNELGADGSTAALVAIALLVCVMAPIAEETFFRGFVFTSFRRSLGLPVAAILTGAIFGAIHLGGTEIEFIVPLAVFGALLCLLYVWTDSLLPCIVLHALNNGLALGVAEDWGAWTPVAMLGAAAICLLITLPVANRSRTVPT